MFKYKKILLLIMLFSALESSIVLASFSRVTPFFKRVGFITRCTDSQLTQNHRKFFSYKKKQHQSSCNNPDHDSAYNFLAILGSLTSIYISTKVIFWSGQFLFGDSKKYELDVEYKKSK